MKIQSILTLVIFTNCISSAYSKKFDPVQYSYSLNEYEKIQPLTVGSEIEKKGKDGEMFFQFGSILFGKGRMLFFQIHHEEKKFRVFDSFNSQNSKSTSILFYKAGNNFFDENRKIQKNDLINSGIRKEDLNDEMMLISLSEFMDKIRYVRITRKKDDPEIFEKSFMPRTAKLYSDEINWYVRSQPIYFSKNVAYYLGFVVTVPLDIITLPVQLIGGAYILFSGGFVK